MLYWRRVTPASPSRGVSPPRIEYSTTPAAASRGPVTVRTPQEATRDSFSISDPTTCNRSMAVFTRPGSGDSRTSRRDTWARHAAATRRSPRHQEGPFTRTRCSGNFSATWAWSRASDSAECSPHVDTVSISMVRFGEPGPARADPLTTHPARRPPRGAGCRRAAWPRDPGRAASVGRAQGPAQGGRA